MAACSNYLSRWWLATEIVPGRHQSPLRAESVVDGHAEMVLPVLTQRDSQVTRLLAAFPERPKAQVAV
jgi:hypothetical protein